MSKRKEKFEDDGRVIANMNVDGMPWHGGFSRRDTGEDSPSDEQVEHNRAEMSKLSKKQTLYMVLGVLGAALAVAAIVAVVYLLFILFAQFVWFK